MLLGASGIDELAPDWPRSGQSPGARRWRCWPCVVVVVVVVGGGGGEGKDGTVTICDLGDVSNTVAQFGNPRAPINS